MPTSDSTTGTGQVPPGSQSPDGNGQVPPTSQASTQDDHANGNGSPEPSSTNTLTPEQLQDALKKARADAAKLRVDHKRLAELEAAEQQRQDAALSEKERYERQLADYQTKLAEEQQRNQERVIRADVRSAAKDLGIKAELAYKLLDYAAITFNEDGDPTNVAELLSHAVQEFGIMPAGTAAAASGTSQQQQQQPASQTPQTGSTNPPRGSQVAGANGTFARDEIPRLTDPRLWRRGS